MKITNIIFDKISVKLKVPFVVALGVVESCDTLIVKITTDEGYYGFGEASPFAPVTGETLDSVIAILSAFREQLIGQDPLNIDGIHYIMDRIAVGNTAAKASIDIALYDIMGKVMNAPLYKVLGGYSNKVQTDMTIGINKPELMAKEAVQIVRDGYHILKVKAGISPSDDIEAIRLIREAVGNDIIIKMDANQGWNVNSAINTLKALEAYDVKAVEQALPYWDIDGAAFIRKQSKIKIMLDESLHSPMDAINIVKKEAADILNIKLMKSGGLYPALKINAIAEAAGLHCMLGCMLETKVAITAAASLVAAQKNITDADLDSWTYFETNTISGGVSLDGDVLTMSEASGLGIEVNI